MRKLSEAATSQLCKYLLSFYVNINPLLGSSVQLNRRKMKKCRLRIVDPPVLFIWNSEITLMLRTKTRE